MGRFSSTRNRPERLFSTLSPPCLSITPLSPAPRPLFQRLPNTPPREFVMPQNLSESHQGSCLGQPLRWQLPRSGDWHHRVPSSTGGSVGFPLQFRTHKSAPPSVSVGPLPVSRGPALWPPPTTPSMDSAAHAAPPGLDKVVQLPRLFCAICPPPTAWKKIVFRCSAGKCTSKNILWGKKRYLIFRLF